MRAILFGASVLVVLGLDVRDLFDPRFTKEFSWGWELALIMAVLWYVRTPSFGWILPSIIVFSMIAFSQVSVTWSWMLVYGVVIDLGIRGFHWRAFAVFVVLHASFIYETNEVLIEVMRLTVFGSACLAAVAVGRIFVHRTEFLEAQVIASQEEMRRAEVALREGLALDLHDTLAASMTRIMFAARAIGTAGERVRRRRGDYIATEAQNALKQLRAMISTLTEEGESVASRITLAEAIETAEKALAQRDIELDVNIAPEAQAVLGQGDADEVLLVAIVRESTLNCLKYGAAGGVVSVVCEADDQFLHITCASTRYPYYQDEESLRGGYGLAALENRFRRAGGALDVKASDTSWLVIAALPIEGRE